MFTVVGDRLEKMRAGNVVCIPKNVAPDILNNVEKLNVVRAVPRLEPNNNIEVISTER
ncbi:hypothetical protein [Okeania sp. SIO3I5]|uniref:hypothetical protein n=1 Tax=Okeania sp. SIO3I5 TaxID=2607805 RepID=UPI0025D72B5B|nr:hypothetical protein [Okeania sp. SIO3I5]